MCSTVEFANRLIYRTPALHSDDARWFTDRGFVVAQSLVMLATECRPLPTTLDDDISAWSWRKMRARRNASTLRHVIALDAESFPPPWNLSRDAFANACRATDEHAFLVSSDDLAGVRGFALVGRTASSSYLQRLAVHPEQRRQGAARRLVRRALAWSHRRGATTMYVNTEPDNLAALALYESLGFQRLPERLSVLERECITSS